MQASIEQTVGLIAERLQQMGRRMATAESCTGGWIAKMLTDRAGSSVWFERGYVTYSNQAKQDDLNVPESVLIEHGAVSEATVLAMASGAARRAAVDVAVAVSGVAGPGGGSDDKPVGTVWIAWAVDGQTTARRFQFDGGRDAVREQAVIEALNALGKLL